MAVAETIELGRGALGVRSHLLKVEPVAHVQDAVKRTSPGDEVNAIAGGAPEGVIRGLTIVAAVLLAQDARTGVLMIEDDAREIPVDAVVEIQHVGIGSGGRVLDVASSNDIASDGEGRGDIVTSRLADDADAGWKAVIQSAAEHMRHILEGLAGESTPYI